MPFCWFCHEAAQVCNHFLLYLILVLRKGTLFNVMRSASLNVCAQALNSARDLSFCLKFSQGMHTLWVNSEGSDVHSSLNLCWSHMSHVTRKPIYAICEQQSQISLRSLMSAFVVCYLDSIIPLVSISKISCPYLAFYSCTGQFGSYLVANPEDRFSGDEAHMF